MKINTYRNEKWETMTDKLKRRGMGAYAATTRPWRADIDGPWYSDSNPEGTGYTEEEAVTNALAALTEVYEMVGAFLKEKGKLGA